MRGPVLLALWLALASCGAHGDERQLIDSFDAALARARAGGTLLLVHFRLPGRPLSDAMDAALAAAPTAAFAGFEQARLDATVELDRYRALVAGSGRAGAGLATCIVDPDGAALAVHTGYLSAAGLGAFATSARRLGVELHDALNRIAKAPADPRPRLLLADLHLRLGRRALATEKLRSVQHTAPEPWSSQAAATLARIAVDDGDLDATRAWLAKAKPSQELAADLALTQGRLQLADCEPKRARATLEAAAARFADTPQAPALLLALGQARHEAGADEDALATFTDLITRLPDSPTAVRARELAEHVRRGDAPHSHGEQTR